MVEAKHHKILSIKKKQVVKPKDLKYVVGRRSGANALKGYESLVPKKPFGDIGTPQPKLSNHFGEYGPGPAVPIRPLPHPMPKTSIGDLKRHGMKSFKHDAYIHQKVLPKNKAKL